MSDMVRVGFIGCGGVSNGHATRLNAIPEAEIVALNDVDPDRLRVFKERHPETADCPTFDDYRKMLRFVEMDAVEIHTPHTAHFRQIMDALRKGLHVLTEKPMVCSVDHARRVIAESEKQGKILMVSYQRHFQPSFRFIREQIQSGALGKLQFVSALQCQDWQQGQQGKWRLDAALAGGGQLNDSGSHLVDIILWTTGLRVSEAMAYVDHLGEQVDINSAVSFTFENGAQGNLSIVGNSPGWWEDLTFWGSKGVIFYRNGEIKVQYLEGKLTEPGEMPKGTDPDTNFIEAILGRAEVEVPATCGLRVIELTEAIWKSARNHRAWKVKQ